MPHGVDLGIFSITILGYLLFNQSINYKVFIGLILDYIGGIIN
jgi:multidrug transporter EmrE-like cation transporter